MKKVSYVNLAKQWSEERDEILPLLEEVLASGMYVGGPNVRKFESDIEEKFGISHPRLVLLQLLERGSVETVELIV